MEKSIHQEFERLRQRNDTASEKSCILLLGKLNEEIDSKIESGSYNSLGEITSDWKRFVAKYNSEAKGRFKHICLSQHLLQIMPDGLTRLSQKQLEKLRTEYEAQLKEVRGDLKHEIEENKRITAEFAGERKQLQEKIDDANSVIKSYEKTTRNLKEDKKNLEEEVNHLGRELKAAHEELDGLKGTALKLDKNVKTLQEEKSSLLQTNTELSETLAIERQKSEKKTCSVM